MPAAVVVAAAAYFVFGVLWRRGQSGRGPLAFDTYTEFYPNVRYAWESLRAGGGLLWNPFQNCGQPFHAMSETGLLYPVNFVFAFLGREPGLAACALLNLAIGGLGTFALCRELRLGRAAALCGAAAFELGGTAASLAAWSPMHIAPYVWMPVVLWRLERLLREPRLAAGAWLGVALTMQILPGFPQTVLFTCQVVALRVAWAALTRQLRRPVAVLGAVALGGALPLALAAVQLWPSIEVARISLRSLPLGPRELGYGYTWDALRSALAAPARHPYPGTVLLAAGVMLIALALAHRPRATAWFYLVVALLYVELSLGPNGLLFPWYARLPLGTTFRMPQRSLWVAGFAVAVLTAFGADALLRAGPAGTRRRRWTNVPLLLGAGALFFTVIGRWPFASEWVAGAALVLAGAAPPSSRGARAAAVAVVLAVVVDGAATSRFVPGGLRSGDLYGANAEAFALLRARLTAQDRVAIVPRHADTTLMPKSASLFRVASIHDYEPQVSRAYAEYYTWLRTGRGLQSINDWYYTGMRPLAPTYNGRLLDRTAARYLLFAAAEERRTPADPAWRLLGRGLRWAIYENPRALPRARFVPRVAVVPARRTLPTLASGAVDATEVALVTRAPASGFRGTGGNGGGDVQIRIDEPERLVLEVEAAQRGFVLVADQYARGWQGRVDDTPAEILRADGVFRLVEVPRGRSLVTFRYRPPSVYWGASVSVATLVALLAGAAVGAGRRRRRGHVPPGSAAVPPQRPRQSASAPASSGWANV